MTLPGKSEGGGRRAPRHAKPSNDLGGGKAEATTPIVAHRSTTSRTTHREEPELRRAAPPKRPRSGQQGSVHGRSQRGRADVLGGNTQTPKRAGSKGSGPSCSPVVDTDCPPANPLRQRNQNNPVRGSWLPSLLEVHPGRRVSIESPPRRVPEGESGGNPGGPQSPWISSTPPTMPCRSGCWEGPFPGWG